MFGDPITPVVEGVKTVAAKWPLITSFAIADYASGMVLQMAPSGSGMGPRLLQAGFIGAVDIFKFGVWEAGKNQYH